MRPRTSPAGVRLVDPSRNVDREVLIWMNHPLRYRGDTIYQQGFMTRATSTPPSSSSGTPPTPAVISPPSSAKSASPPPPTPYPTSPASSGLLGLLIHFGMHLIGLPRPSLQGLGHGSRLPKKERPRKRQLHPEPPPPLIMRPGSGSPPPRLLWPRSTSSAWPSAPPPSAPDPYDFAGFGRLPVVSDGRVLPFDSLARNTLRIISGHDTLERDGKKIQAVQWLLDGFAEAEAWRKDQGHPHRSSRHHQPSPARPQPANTSPSPR